MENRLFDNYDDYLQSEEWYSLKKQRAEIDGFKCCMCGCTGTQNNPLRCHHVTYRNLYHENVYTELMTLCQNCHQSIHHAMNRITDPSGRRGWKDELIPSRYVMD